jgi:hypothetical protein
MARGRVKVFFFFTSPRFIVSFFLIKYNIGTLQAEDKRPYSFNDFCILTVDIRKRTIIIIHTPNKILNRYNIRKMYKKNLCNSYYNMSKQAKTRNYVLEYGFCA